MTQGLSKKRIYGNVIFCVAVFSAMLVFFAVLHPIPIMDEDDVIYTVLVRKAIPVPGSWNPSRMMPEVLTSLCGNLAALATAFGLGRFIDCQVAVYGFVLSIFITVYVWAFFQLLEKRFSCSRFQAVCLSILFLMLHFLIFRTEYSRNTFMFHTYDACCVFYYTVPAMLGCTMVMCFMKNPDETPVLNGLHPVKESLLLLVLYFEVFSNLFGSAILASYAGYRIVQNMFHKEKVYSKQNRIWFAILFCWLLAAVLEATGGRAAGVREQATEGTLSLPVRIVQAVVLFSKTLWHSNLFFKLLVLAVAIITTLLIVVRRKSNTGTVKPPAFGETAIWGFATSAVVLLLCAAVEPRYTGRPEVFFPISFVVFLLLIQGMIIILYHYPACVRILPILLIFVYSMTNTRLLTFQDSNPLRLNGHVAVAIENEIYESIIAAAEAGESEVTVRVIHSSESGNWPHDGLIGEPMAQFFLKYGIIDHEIRVHTQPSDEMNAEYGVPIP